jgi:hypothetical protein
MAAEAAATPAWSPSPEAIAATVDVLQKGTSGVEADMIAAMAVRQALVMPRWT